MEQAAQDIYQDWLDRVSRLLWRRDFSGVAAAMFYPHCMSTRDAVMEFHTPGKLVEAAKDFREALERRGALNYARLCTSAVALSDDWIEGTHQTFILSGGSYVIEPFLNAMTLRRVDGAWLGAGLRSDVLNADCTIVSVRHLAEVRRHGT